MTDTLYVNLIIAKAVQSVNSFFVYFLLFLFLFLMATPNISHSFNFYVSFKQCQYAVYNQVYIPRVSQFLHRLAGGATRLFLDTRKSRAENIVRLNPGKYLEVLKRSYYFFQALEEADSFDFWPKAAWKPLAI